MSFWEGPSWTYDDESGYHHNHNENWGFHDGDYGSESDYSGGDDSCDCDYD